MTAPENDQTEDGAAAPERPARQWEALSHGPFARYFVSRAFALFAVQIQTVAIGWQVYDTTRNPLDLGLVGLSQFAPALLLVLVTGAVADRFPRKRIMAICLFAQAAISVALLTLALAGGSVAWIFALLVAFGVARAFLAPASRSLLPNIVPRQLLSNAIALSSTIWQLAAICGPVMGGLLYGVSPMAAYGTAAAFLVIAAGAILLVPRPDQKEETEPPGWQTVVAGFRYIWREKIVLGAISLDLFAVLLGGATAMLPVYARDVLDVGPLGLGLLRAAPGIGAISVALYLATRGIRDHAGLWMFLFVGVFGLLTIVFGASTIAWLSIAALIGMGAADMVSVYIRETLIQLWTPDRVRGRVNAVNMVFIGASNELGEFRAGAMAEGLRMLFAGAMTTAAATVLAAQVTVVTGGVGTVIVALLWAKMFPQLRKARHMDGRV